MKKKENLPVKYSGKIDLEQAFKLRFVKGLTFEEIAKVFDVTSSAVSQRLSKFVQNLPDPESIQTFKENLVQMLDAGVLKAYMACLDDEKLSKAKLWEVNNLFGTMFDKKRLAEGKSTSNIAYKEVTKEIEALEKAIKEYQDSKLSKKLMSTNDDK